MNVRFFLSYDNKILKSHFWRKKLMFCQYVRNFAWMSFHNVTKICKPLVAYQIIMHGAISAISLPDTMSHDKNVILLEM